MAIIDVKCRCFICEWHGYVGRDDDVKILDCPQCGKPSLVIVEDEPNPRRDAGASPVSSSCGEYLIPFGKHEGKKLRDVPVMYLDWMMGLKDLREPFRSQLTEYMSDPMIASEIDEKLDYRGGSAPWNE